MKALNYLFVILIIFALTIEDGTLFGVQYLPDSHSKLEAIPTKLEEAKKIFPTLHSMQKEKEITYIYNKRGESLGYILNSTPLADSITGYVNRVPVLVGVDTSQIIRGVVMLENYESPEYLQMINNSQLLSSWNGRHVEEGHKNHVDVVSGATETSRALIQTVKTALSKYTNQSVSDESHAWTEYLSMSLTIALLLFALLSYFWRSKFRAFRTWLLTASIIILGFWQVQFLSFFIFKNYLVFGLPIFSHALTVTILLLAFVLPLFQRRSFYCNFLCPFGALQEIANKLFKYNIRIPNNIRNTLEYASLLYLMILIMSLILNFRIDVSVLEPFSALNYKVASTATIVFAVLILFASLFIKKPWCTFLCPTGRVIRSISMIKSNR